MISHEKETDQNVKYKKTDLISLIIAVVTDARDIIFEPNREKTVHRQVKLFHHEKNHSISSIIIPCG